MARTRISGLALLVLVIIFVASCSVAFASGPRDGCESEREAAPPHPALRWDGDAPLRTRAAAGTLWTFDADFENLTGDNAGWTSRDLSGTIGQTNYWHKDTIRIRDFTHLGDSTWWCGKYDECWVQPRGYGNNWVQSLSREFPLSDWSSPGDDVTLEWDQRYAIEGDYDYGYVDVSTDGGVTWSTLEMYTNINFAGQPGQSIDWDHATRGHPVFHMNSYAGTDVVLRYRFESDLVYSSQDAPDSEPHHSVLDGAWQLDNIEWKVNESTVWLDDCESPGDNGWAHDDIQATGQTGVVYERTWMPKTMVPGCAWRPRGWWMAAVDPVTGRTVDGQHSRLLSPPIDVEGLDLIIAQWDCWVALSNDANDHAEVLITTSTSAECVYSDNTLDDPVTVWGPYSFWFAPMSGYAEWDNGDAWLGIMADVYNDAPAPSPEDHSSGFLIDRLRVGTPVGRTATEWDYSPWDAFYDTFDASEAEAHVAPINIFDDDGIAGVWVVASSDGGTTWESRALSPAGGYDWDVHMPVGVVVPGTEIIYYFEALDGEGNTSTHPRNAPDAHYEFSILPIHGSVSEPGLLLVDKSYGSVPGENGLFRHPSEYYYREALDVLGYEYDVFDVRVPGSSSPTHMAGPDTSGMRCYDTQIWFTGRSETQLLSGGEQADLITWLAQSADGAERNFMLAGNSIGEWLMMAGGETLDFYVDWLGSEFVTHTRLDTMPDLRDNPGEFDFLTHDDGLTHLWDDG